MDSKLIFLDIDGTLTLPCMNEPPESAVRAVGEAQRRGHLVYLCTGRNIHMLSPLLKVGFDGIISSAGGYILCGDEVIYDCPLTEEQRIRTLDILKRNHIFRTIEAKDAAYGDEGLREFFLEAGRDPDLEENSGYIRWRTAMDSRFGIRPMSEYDGRPLYKIIFMCLEREQLDEAERLLEDEFVFSVDDSGSLSGINGELINRRFSKATGIRKVANRLGISLSDTIGFGDSVNDLSMMEAVHTSVCMENGSEQLKRVSTLICPRVDKDGLAEGFRMLGLI